MSQAGNSALITQRLRTMQLVAGVLIVSPVLLFGVALLMGAQADGHFPRLAGCLAAGGGRRAVRQNDKH
jgi:hypothetical protein